MATDISNKVFIGTHTYLERMGRPRKGVTKYREVRYGWETGRYFDYPDKATYDEIYTDFINTKNT